MSVLVASWRQRMDGGLAVVMLPPDESHGRVQRGLHTLVPSLA